MNKNYFFFIIISINFLLNHQKSFISILISKLIIIIFKFFAFDFKLSYIFNDNLINIISSNHLFDASSTINTKFKNNSIL